MMGKVEFTLLFGLSENVLSTRIVAITPFQILASKIYYHVFIWKTISILLVYKYFEYFVSYIYLYKPNFMKRNNYLTILSKFEIKIIKPVPNINYFNSN